LFAGDCKGRTQLVGGVDGGPKVIQPENSRSGNYETEHAERNRYFLIGKLIGRQAQAPTPKIQDKTGSSAYASCIGSYQN
jgi:hypothetical protein